MGIAFLVGAAILVLPVALDPSHGEHSAAFLPLVGDAVEGLKPYSLLLLIVFSIFMGAVFRAPVLLAAACTVAVFPLWSAIDMSMRSNGHNLFPIEWAIYAFYGTLALLGCGIGRAVRRIPPLSNAH